MRVQAMAAGVGSGPELEARDLRRMILFSWCSRRRAGRQETVRQRFLAEVSAGRPELQNGRGVEVSWVDFVSYAPGVKMFSALAGVSFKFSVQSQRRPQTTAIALTHTTPTTPTTL